MPAPNARFPDDPHAQRIWDELMKLPHGVLVAMYREFKHQQDASLADLPRWGAERLPMPPHTASNDDLAVALAPALVRRDFMRRDPRPAEPFDPNDPPPADWNGEEPLS